MSVPSSAGTRDLPDPPPTQRATAKRASCTRVVLIIVAIAALLRLWYLVSLPLIVTNDGVGYLNWGMQIASGKSFDEIPTFRTPGYSILLAGVFTVLGTGPVPILFTQHLLGCLTVALVTFVACRAVGPRWGWIPGLLCALDPWLLATECYALNETLAIALVAIALTLILAVSPPRYLAGLALGLALGYLALVRPALQVLTVFFILAWALRVHRDWKTTVGGLACAVVGVAAVLGPWMKYNHDRKASDGAPAGYQVASGYNVMQCRGLFRFRLLDPDFPDDPKIRAEVNRYRKMKRMPRWGETRNFVDRVGEWDDSDGFLARWNRASIRKNFSEYARHCLYALCWELNFFPTSGPDPDFDWLNASLRRLSWDTPNNWYRGDPKKRGVDMFTMSGSRGALRGLNYLVGNLLAERNDAGERIRPRSGFPQVPLFGLAVLTLVLALFRRDWYLVVLLLGMLAFVAVHVLILFPVGRYLMPVWPIWYLCVVFAPKLLKGRLGFAADNGQPRISTEPVAAAAEPASATTDAPPTTPPASE